MITSKADRLRFEVDDGEEANDDEEAACEADMTVVEDAFLCW